MQEAEQIRANLAGPATPAGGPCEVTITLVVEPGVALDLPAIFDAIAGRFDGPIAVDRGRGPAIGGGLFTYRWRVSP